jgi:hypothetical protein
MVTDYKKVNLPVFSRKFPKSFHVESFIHLEKNNNFIFLGYATKYDTVEN